MTAEERSAWARYMLQHQPRFWDGRTLPKKPVRARVADSVGVSPVDVPPAVSAPQTREAVPAPIPAIVVPRRPVVEPRFEPWTLRPARRWNV